MCVFAIQEAMVILMKVVDLRKNINAHRAHVEVERNANKVSILSIVFVRLVSMEIPTLAVMISTSVHQKYAGKMQFVSTHQAATTANVNKASLEIRSKCVHQFKKVFVKIHQTANVTKM